MDISEAAPIVVRRFFLLAAHVLAFPLSCIAILSVDCQIEFVVYCICVYIAPAERLA
jgi:hypothetical protein